MADKDPFAEQDDNEKTVIRPNPGGRRPATPTQPPASGGGQGGAGAQTYGTGSAAPSTTPSSAMGVPNAASRQRQGGEALPISLTGVNQLVAVATPLFSLISRIRNRAQHSDAERLRQSVMAEVRTFENTALKAGEDAQKVKIARYALCATLDDVVLNTPWGEQSSWAMQSLVGTFHRETVGGDRFYDLLARLEQDPAANIDLLEFIYMCLSLGFEGRLRVESGGQDKHLQIRNSLARIIRGQRGEFERDLSPRWKGVNRPHVALSPWKWVWVAVGATAAILALTFGGFSYLLGQRSGAVMAQITALDPGGPPTLKRRAPPPPPPPPPPPQIDRVAQLSTFLAPEIKQGVVNVLRKGSTVIIRLTGSGMFGSGSDVLSRHFVPIVKRVGEALKTEKGHVVVVGYSDNTPVGPGRFKSNEELSRARADAVLKILLPLVGDPSRMMAEGRGPKDPIASNSTRAGRAKNRRVEINIVSAGQGN